MRSVTCLIFLFFIVNSSWASNDPRVTSITRANESIKIDGHFNEQAWETAIKATGFKTSQPVPYGTPNGDTEVRLLYTDNAVYIAAIMHDPEPDKILRPLSARDEFSNASWFGVTFDTYQTGVNGVAFIITAAGVQVDMQLNPDGDDENWDTVWKSATRITEDGWVAELEIPFAALRFPETVEQKWNIQFGRQARRIRESSFWNPLDPEIAGFINQCGVLEGIKDIKPPVRLSFTPFVVGGFNSSATPDESNSSSIYGAGLDMKLGLNDAFTLDMTLVPDFSNTISDQQVLNLSPFEVFFEENRQFFTEGTELFSKGDFFYSRRIGSNPINSIGDGDLAQREEYIQNPGTNQLINATKISGRTEKGLGIGVFNAIEGATYAKIRNTLTNEEREVQTNPLTNYNVLVLDQNLKNNSFVSFVNTNVFREGSTYDANVTGAVFRILDKSQKFRLRGKAGLSQKYYTTETELGHTYSLGLAKTGGKWSYGLDYREESDTYDPNDLGFLFNNNERSWEADLSYNQYEPIGKFNRYEGWLNFEYTRLYQPNAFTDMAINTNWFFLTKKFFAFGAYARLEPIDTYDYFEPRTSDLSAKYRYPKNFIFNPFISTDYSKTFAFDLGFNFRGFDEPGRYTINYFFSPRWRATNQLNFILEAFVSYRYNDVGFTDKDDAADYIFELKDEDIMFGIRDRFLVENALRIQFVLNKNTSLNMRIRHYWDRVEYNSFTRLEEDGSLSLLSFNGRDENDAPIYNADFDLINIDMNFTWRFAPGSDIILTWKNNGLIDQNDPTKGYFNALSRVYSENKYNELTFKVLYFLDANYLLKKKK